MIVMTGNPKRPWITSKRGYAGVVGLLPPTQPSPPKPSQDPTNRYGGGKVPGSYVWTPTYNEYGQQYVMGAAMTRGQYLYGGALGGALIGLFTTWLLKGKGAAYLVGAGIGAGVGAGYGFLRSL